MIATARLIVLICSAILASGGAALSVALLPTSEPTTGGVDHGLDTDGDGAYDWLLVEASVVLPVAGMWDVQAQLTTQATPTTGACGGVYMPIPLMDASSPEWPIAWAYERYFFEAGAQVVRIGFPGTDIYRSGIDGPYGVHAYLYSYDGSIVGMPWPGTAGSSVEWRHTTEPYHSTDFDEPHRTAYFTGAFTEAPIHVDADGLYDLFELTASVRVNDAGNYSLNGQLFQSDGSRNGTWTAYIAYAYADVSLEAGEASVSLWFRGDQIRAAGVDGPWNFTLSLYGPYDYYWRNATAPGVADIMPMPYPENLCGVTGPYRAASFDDTVELLRYTGVFSEAVEDWNGNGRYDVLVIRAEVEAFVAAGFDLRGSLRSEDGAREVATSWTAVWLPAGIGRVEFVFAGADIHASGVDGPYLATLSITPSAGGIDPVTDYTTRAYQAADFEEGPSQWQPYWIQRLEAAAVPPGAVEIFVEVLRGNDSLTYVAEDVLTTTLYDAAGNAIWSITDRVYLPSGGSSQSFAYRVDGLSSGTYRIVVLLGTPDRPVDQRSADVTL